jgi:hypothetical protein
MWVIDQAGQRISTIHKVSISTGDRATQSGGIAGAMPGNK